MAVYFPVFNGIVYAFDHDNEDFIVPAKQSSRYRGNSKSIIDFAIASLEGKPNGKWAYSDKEKHGTA